MKGAWIAQGWAVSAFAALLLLGAVNVPTADGAPPAGIGGLVWADEFDGTTLNYDNWRIGAGLNGPVMYTANALVVDNGALTVKTYTEGGVHHTGWIDTQWHTGNQGLTETLFKYGYFEARIQFNTSPGQWSAFWLNSYGMNNEPGYPLIVGNPAATGTEIDVIEHRRTNNSGVDFQSRLHMANHWNGYGSAHDQDSHTTGNIAGMGNGSWHTYGLLWEPDKYTFYFDDQVMWTVTNAISQTPEFLLLTSQIQHNSWAGSIPAGGYGSFAASTTNMMVDYVRAYALTPEPEPEPIPESPYPWERHSLAFTHQYNGNFPVTGYQQNGPFASGPSSTNGVLSYRSTVESGGGYFRSSEWDAAINPAVGWTIELRIKIGTDAEEGPEKAFDFVVTDGASGPAGYRAFYIGQNYFGTRYAEPYDTSDNTDDFHVFRVAKAGGSDQFTVWRDGAELGTTTGFSDLASLFMYWGDGGGNIGGPTVEIDYVRFDNTGAYAPIGSTVAGDFTGDGFVDGEDLAQWMLDFGQTGNSDADGDGDSDGNDFLVWQRNVAAGADHAAPVPEPKTLALAIAALLLARRRREGRRP